MMPMSAIKAHLDICKALSAELQVHFPDGIVVPFGAAISGHGTLTSDCDICLLTHPSREQRVLFSGSSYHPLGLASQQVDAALVDSPSLPTPLPSTPTREDSFTSSSEASSASASPTQMAVVTRTSTHEFDVVASCVRSMGQCSKILAIPRARCPIVRFVFEPLGIHCDLSINNL